MKSDTRQPTSRNSRQSFGLWNTRVGLIALLAVALGASGLSTRGWQQFVSASSGQPAGQYASLSKSLRLLPESESTNSVLPGALDLSFGVDGTVTVDLGNNLADSGTAVAVQPDGKVVAVGYVSTSSTGKDFAVIRLDTSGALDGTFSDDGKLTFNFNSGTRDDIARAAAIQPDGKILIVGEADVLGSGNFDIVVARLTSDGSFDASFGTNGKVVTNLPNNRPDFGRALVLQPDGRIVVSGYSNRSTTGDDFVVVRYDSNGLLDTTFNSTGIVTTDILTNRADRASSIALQPDGNIVVGGYTNDPSFKNDFAVVRYTTNGSLDSSFNGTGKVHTDLNLNSDDFGNAITLQSDGAIVVAGESASDFGLVRYNQNGSLDMAFGGGDGIVTTNFGTNAADAGRAVIVQPGGKIIVAGKSRTELAAARYNSDGTLDPTFDTDGLLVQNAGNNQLSPFGGYSGMALQSDGKIVLTGDGWRDFSANDFTVSRLNANGTFDFNFNGGDGITSTDISGRYDEARSVARQSDGKLVVAGGAQNATGGYDIALARYNGNGTLDTSFDVDGIVITDIQGHPDEGAFAVVIQPDGKIVVAGQTDNATDGNLSDGLLIRYNMNGSLDPTFGTGGIVILKGSTVQSPAATWVYLRDMKLQADGKIVVAGQAHYTSINADGLVARFNSNGTLDSYQLMNFNSTDDLQAVALQADGKIVVTGWTNEGPAGDLTLARLNSNFTLDTTFDGDGKLTTDFGNNTFDAGTDVKVQPDGKIIVAGQTDINFRDFAVARYNSDGSPDTTFGGGDGKLNIDFATWSDTCNAMALQPDGKIILVGVGDLDRNFSGVAIVRLTSSGAFDTTFNGNGRVLTTLGEGVNTGLGQVINDVVLQPDGKIVVVGTSSFDSTDHDFVVMRYAATTPMSTKTGVFRPSTGELFLKNTNSSGFADTYIIFGNPGDYPLAGDWNGDGIDSVGIYRNGTFYLRNTNSTGFADVVVPFGNPGDQPIAGDWNGDGVDTIGVYRNGTFLLRNSNTTGPPDLVFTLGNPGDVGIAGDWNGDGIVTGGVFRPSNGIVYLRNSNSTGFADLSFVFGNAGDKPVAGDWNADGIDTIGIYRNGVFYLSNSNSTGFADIVFVLGNSGDFPIAGNWNGSP